MRHLFSPRVFTATGRVLVTLAIGFAGLAGDVRGEQENQVGKEVQPEARAGAGVVLPSAEVAARRRQVVELRRELWRIEEMLALTPIEVGEAITAAEDRRAEIERALRSLGARVGAVQGAVPDAAMEELLRARGESESLQARIERRTARRNEMGPQQPFAPKREPGDLEIVATSTHSTCETALELGATRVRGIVRPEVWFRLRVPKSMRVGFAAESLESRLSLALFDRCGARGEEATSDLDRRTHVSVQADRGEIWVRLRAADLGRPGIFTMEAILAEGQIAGRVTRAADGSGVPYVTVRARTTSGSSYRSTSSLSTGDYSISLLPPGSYLVGVENTGVLVTERYDGHPCPLDIGCAATTGDPVPVIDSTTTNGIDFALERGGEIGGSVRLWPEGTTSSSADVRIFDASGRYLEWTRTDSAGRYRFEALLGSFRLTASAYGRVSELFEEIPCGDTCTVSQGTAVLVSAPGEVKAANFTLEALGSVSGLVTAPDGTPIASASVVLSSGSPSYYVGTATTDADGRYVVSGLRAAVYRATASKARYEKKVWGGSSCAFLGCDSFSCDLSSGAPIVVGVGGLVPGVDFELHPGQPVRGRVSWEADNSALPGVIVTAGVPTTYCRDGWGESDAAGDYSTLELPPAEYRVYTDNESGAIDEVYSDHRCDLNGCPPEFTPVAVSLLGPTTGVDFALEHGARILGSVTDIHGNPLTLCISGAVLIRRLGESGILGSSCSSGTFSFGALKAGSYTIEARAAGHITELYDDQPCASSCNLGLATPVAVAAGEERSGVDFVLDKPGHLVGTVRDAVTSAGIGFASVLAVDAGGQVLGSAVTGSDGSYQLSRTNGDPVYLVAQGAGLARQLYPGLPCPGALGIDCLPGVGEVVAVGLNQVVAGLDFALRTSGLHGRVRKGHDSSPASFVAIDVFRAEDLTRVATTLTDAQGRFSATASSGPPAMFLVATDNGSGAIDELWQDVACPDGPAWLGLCDLGLATPIPLRDYEVVEGIDFVLSGWPVFKNGFESGSLVGWSAAASE